MRLKQFKTFLFLLFNFNSLTIFANELENDIVSRLQYLYPNLNRGNLVEKVSEWSLDVEQLLRCNPEPGCSVEYYIDTSQEYGLDYRIIPVQIFNTTETLIKNFKISFSMGGNYNIGFVVHEDYPVLFQDPFLSRLVAYKSLLKVKDIEKFQPGEMRNREEMLEYLTKLITFISNPDSEKVIFYLPNETMPDVVNGFKIVANSSAEAGKVYKKSGQVGFSNVSPYIWIERRKSRNLAYMVDNVSEILESVVDKSDQKNSNVLSVNWEGEQKVLNFPFAEIESLQGLYYLFEGKDKNQQTHLFLRKVSTDLSLIGPEILLHQTDKEPFVYAISDKKENPISLIQNFKYTPLINTIYSQDLALDDFISQLEDPLGRIKMFRVPNISKLIESSQNLKEKFNGLRVIDVPFFITANYQEVLDFRRWKNNLIKSKNSGSLTLNSLKNLETQKIQLMAFEPYSILSMQTNDIFEFYQQPAEGFPVDAFRIVRNSPDKYQLVFVAKIITPKGLSELEKKTFTITLICESTRKSALPNELLKDKEFATVYGLEGIKAEDNFYEIPFKIDSLRMCDTLNLENLVLYTDMETKAESGTNYSELDWYIKKK